jgi:hypothetical protein
MPGEDRTRPAFLNFGGCGALVEPCRLHGLHPPVFRPSPRIARGQWLRPVFEPNCITDLSIGCDGFMQIWTACKSGLIWSRFEFYAFACVLHERHADERHGLGSPIGRGLPASPGSSLAVGAGRHACNVRWSRAAPTIFNLGFGGPWPKRAEACRSSRRPC